MKATTLSCSTIRLAMARAAAGSPPSSPKISLTGWPASPPRALMSALHALLAVMIGWTARPMTPLPVPIVPNRIGALAAVGAPPGFPGPGVGAAPGPGVAPEAWPPAPAAPALAAAAALLPVPAVGWPGERPARPELCAGRADAAFEPNSASLRPAATGALAPPVVPVPPDGEATGPSAGSAVAAVAAPLGASRPAAANRAEAADSAPPVASRRARSTRDPQPARTTAASSPTAARPRRRFAVTQPRRRLA